MKKILFCILSLFLCYDIYAFSFGSLLSGFSDTISSSTNTSNVSKRTGSRQTSSSRKNKKKKSSAVVSAVPKIDYTSQRQELSNYCTQESMSYGIQIHCIKQSIPLSFKFDASATVRCSQEAQGINQAYPEAVSLSTEFIQSLNFCPNAKIFGPHTLYKTDVVNKEHDTNLGVQNTQVNTYYDVVCNNSSYSPAIYQKQQVDYQVEVANKLNICVQNIKVNNISSVYILIFEMLIGLALLSFILRFFLKYKNKK